MGWVLSGSGRSRHNTIDDACWAAVQVYIFVWEALEARHVITSCLYSKQFTDRTGATIVD